MNKPPVTREELAGMLGGKIPLDRAAVVQSIRDSAARLGLPISARIGPSGHLEMTDDKGNRLDLSEVQPALSAVFGTSLQMLASISAESREAVQSVVGITIECFDARGKAITLDEAYAVRRIDQRQLSMDQQMDANGVKVVTTFPGGERKVCAARYEIRRAGLEFASCYDPRAALKDDALPEGDYEVWFFCECGDPENAGAFGTLNMYGDGIGVLRGPGGSVWTRDG